MTRQCIVDKDELHTRVMELFKRRCKVYLHILDIPENRKEWSADIQREYKNAHSTVYHQMRRELKDKANNFWLNLIDNGNIKALLEKHGLTIRCGEVCCKDAGSLIIAKYIKETVLPELEELGITGVKMAKRPSGLTRSILDFTKAEVVQTAGTAAEKED